MIHGWDVSYTRFYLWNTLKLRKLITFGSTYYVPTHGPKVHFDSLLFLIVRVKPKFLLILFKCFPWVRKPPFSTTVILPKTSVRGTSPPPPAHESFVTDRAVPLRDGVPSMPSGRIPGGSRSGHTSTHPVSPGQYVHRRPSGTSKEKGDFYRKGGCPKTLI